MTLTAKQRADLLRSQIKRPESTPINVGNDASPVRSTFTKTGVSFHYERPNRMRKGAYRDPVLRKQARELRASGLPFRDIAKQMNCSDAFVRKLLGK